jgi:hypothetical protein
MTVTWKYECRAQLPKLQGNQPVTQINTRDTRSTVETYAQKEHSVDAAMWKKREWILKQRRAVVACKYIDIWANTVRRFQSINSCLRMAL